MTTLHIIISIILALVVTFYFLRWITAGIAMKELKTQRDYFKNAFEKENSENFELRIKLEKAEQRENYRLKRIDDLENEIVKLTGNKKRKSGRKPKHIS